MNYIKSIILWILVTATCVIAFVIFIATVVVAVELAIVIAANILECIGITLLLT